MLQQKVDKKKNCQLQGKEELRGILLDSNVRASDPAPMRFLELSVERRVWLWAAAGPLLVLLSACAAALKGGELGLILSLTGVISLPLCSFLRGRGLLLSLLLLSIAIVWRGQLGEPWAWVGALLISHAIGLLISTLAAGEIVGELDRLEAEGKRGYQEMIDLDGRWKRAEAGWHRREDHLSKELQEALHRLSIAKERMERLEGEGRIDREQIHLLRVEGRRLLYDLDQKKGQLSELREAANRVRCDLYQARLDLQSRPPANRSEVRELRVQLARVEEQLLARSYALEEQEERLREARRLRIEEGRSQGEEGGALNQRLRVALEVIAALKPFRHQYEQLREQFSEKSRLLDQTRTELFHAQEQVAAAQREEAEQALTPTALEEMLAGHAREVELEQRRAEEESERLRQLVSDLLQELASRSVLSKSALELLAHRG